MKVLLDSFHLQGFIHGLGRSKELAQRNEQYHIKVLLNSFYLKAHARVLSASAPVTATISSDFRNTFLLFSFLSQPR